MVVRVGTAIFDNLLIALLSEQTQLELKQLVNKSKVQIHYLPSRR